MGNNHAKNLVVNRGDYHDKYSRPHSVLGLNESDRMGGSDYGDIRPTKSKDKSKGGAMGGRHMLPPLLPRSHSFHQILRPTENGVNLAQKGTIRGFGGMFGDNSKLVLEPLGSPRAPQQRGQEDPLNPELIAILKSRRCKSETNLIQQQQHGQESGSSALGLNGFSAGGGGGGGSGAQDGYQSSEAGSTSQTDGRTLVLDGVRKKGLSNGVAAKIQKAKYKAPPPPPPPLANSAGPSAGSGVGGLNGHHQTHQYSLQPTQIMSSMSACLSDNERERDGLVSSGGRNGVASRRSLANASTQADHHHHQLTNGHGHRQAQPTSSSGSGLMRRQSEKSYLITGARDRDGIGHELPSRQDSSATCPVSGVPLIPRLKLAHVSASNPVVDLRKDRNLIFDSKQIAAVGRLPAAPPQQQTEPRGVHQELVVQQQQEQFRGHLNGNSDKSPASTATQSGYESFLDELEMNFSKPRNQAGAAVQDNDKSFFSSRQPQQQRLDSAIGSNYRSTTVSSSQQPLFDDNFILRRATPTAGLNPSPRDALSNSQLRNGQQRLANAFKPTQRPVPYIGKTPSPLLHSSPESYAISTTNGSGGKNNGAPQFRGTAANAGSNNRCGPVVAVQLNGHQEQQQQHQSHLQLGQHQYPRPPPPPSHGERQRHQQQLYSSNGGPGTGANHQLQANDTLHDPTVRANNFTPKAGGLPSFFSQTITTTPSSSSHHQHNSYVSDSANYSDEEEEEIRIVLKPRLPPPRRPPLLVNERPTEDIFTQVAPPPNPLINAERDFAARHQCWTPMEDLSSSEEDCDDGIHCDQPSDEYEAFPTQQIRYAPNGREVVTESGHRGDGLMGDSYGDSTRFTLQNQLRTLVQSNKLRHQVYS